MRAHCVVLNPNIPGSLRTKVVAFDAFNWSLTTQLDLALQDHWITGHGTNFINHIHHNQCSYINIIESCLRIFTGTWEQQMQLSSAWRMFHPCRVYCGFDACMVICRWSLTLHCKMASVGPRALDYLQHSYFGRLYFWLTSVRLEHTGWINASKCILLLTSKDCLWFFKFYPDDLEDLSERALIASYLIICSL